jgi:hypothetical protein
MRELQVTMTEPCQGGCGKPMPPGQKCYECAVAAVDAWRQAKKGIPQETLDEDAGSKRGKGAWRS